MSTSPIRVFETYNSYRYFLPLIYAFRSAPHYDNVWSTLCYDYIEMHYEPSSVADHICKRFGYDAIDLYKASGSNYRIGGELESVDLTYYDNNYTATGNGC